MLIDLSLVLKQSRYILVTVNGHVIALPINFKRKTRCKHILAVTACVNESKVAVFDDEPLEEGGRQVHMMSLLNRSVS